ncbi:hypothetical protein DSM112329_04763 [Paraconexibacter sp. AEG42_29]|uniref:SHOCT domain-containing protein n=1 Tax=Paraconexibacter sp. AEG42_29 TaxID=2997339 RepID=A0AAU7B1I3_9ACTN
MRAASAIPVVQNHPLFVLLDEARLNAISNLKSAATDIDRLEQLLILNNCWTWQIDELREIMEDLDPGDPASRVASDWISAWTSEAKQISAYGDQQNALVARVGRGEAQLLADGHVRPLLESVKQQARGRLQARLEELKQRHDEMQSQAAGSPHSFADELLKLVSLRDAGALTDDEFAVLKARLMAG